MANKTIHELDAITGSLQATDKVIIDQKQPDDSYLTKSATLQQLADTLEQIIPENAGEGYDDFSTAYTTLPLVNADILGAENAIVINSDSTVYSSSTSTAAALGNLYIKYPGYSSYQKISQLYIPKMSTGRAYLNLPPGTSVYTDSTGTAVNRYIKLSSKLIDTEPYKFDKFHMTKILLSELRTDLTEVRPGVYVYCKYEEDEYMGPVAKIYVKNTSSNTVFSQIKGSTVTKLCKYLKSDGTEYSEDGYKKTNLKKLKVNRIKPTDGEAAVAQFRIRSRPAGWGIADFYYEVLMQPEFQIQIYSLNNLK